MGSSGGSAIPPTGIQLAWDLGWGGATTLVGGLLWLYRAGHLTALRPGVDRLTRWASRTAARPAIAWALLLAAVAAVFAVGAALQSGPFSCGSGVDDVGAFVASGVQARAGTDPFSVVVCGQSVGVPYGAAGVALNAIGSFGGRPGVWVAWLLPALAILPLASRVAGSERRIVVATILTSVLFVPVVTDQIDGASNALVPLAVLLALLAGRTATLGGAVAGGLLATARFPALFPGVAAGGASPRRPALAVVSLVAAFVVPSALAYLAWGPSFVNAVFLGQFGRTSFSLNGFGLLIDRGWLPPGSFLLGVQAGGVLATIILTRLRGWEAVPSAGAVLVVTALLAQFFTFNFLIWLLPVVLVSERARRWLWAVGTVGAIDYSLAYAAWDQGSGLAGPYELLGLLLTGLLLALLIEVARSGERHSDPSCPEAGVAPS